MSARCEGSAAGAEACEAASGAAGTGMRAAASGAAGAGTGCGKRTRREAEIAVAGGVVGARVHEVADDAAGARACGTAEGAAGGAPVSSARGVASGASAVELRGASFRYEDGDAGVEGVDLVVHPGECVVLTGPSGSGKTTVTRLVNGLAPAYWHGELAGEVRIGGIDAAALPLWERGRAVASVFQDPASQFFSFELAGEVAFACENYGMPTREIVERTDTCIAAFDLERVRDRPLDALSSGEKQRVAVASAVAPGSRVLVCDEPTANLDADGAALLASQVAQLKAAGCAVLVSEHRLAWLAGIADRYAYLEGGRVRWQRSASEMRALSAGERERFGLRSASAVALPELARPEDARTSADGTAPSLEARRLACRRGGHAIWEDVSFRTWPGQVVALTGRNGAGKSTLARVLAGLARQSAGEVLVGGRALRSAARRRRVFYGANDTATQFFTSSVSDELLLGRVRDEGLIARARDTLGRLGLMPFKDAHPATLSGGQRQRLALACGLLSDRPVLVFDEPTSGLDGASMRIVATALSEAARAGRTVIVITHDGELAERCCTCRLRMEELA